MKIKNIKNILKNKYFWIMVAVIAIGAFLRAWHFEDWMHYQLDQARDYKIIHAAIEYGPGELPLQGPRAAGSFLRLGPLFYYLEYLSALVFGDTPTGSTIIILILNVLAIPLFYALIRRFFIKDLAVGLSGIFAVSIFMVTYSRFGWNPTLLPFFMMLLMYSTLKASDDENKYREWWLVLASGALAFTMNMHFIAFAAAPVMLILYFAWTRPKFALKYWVLAASIFIFLNIPLIINDIKTGGDNSVEFFEIILDRSKDEKNEHTLVEKLVTNAGLHARYNWLILTGDQSATLPEIKGRDIMCDHDCRKGMAQGIISALIIAFGAISWIMIYLLEKDRSKKNFLKLVAIWGVVIFGIYTLLAYDIAPRFFLFNAPLALIMFGLMLRIFIKENGSIGKKISIFIIILCVISNIVFVGKYFNELSSANKDPDFKLASSDRILKEKTRVTLSQMEEIVDFMENKYKKNKYPVFVHAQPEYKRAFWERVDIRNIPRSNISSDLKPLYRQGNYFLIVRSQSDQDDYLGKYLVGMHLIDKTNFGTLNVYELSPKTNYITAEKKIFEKPSRDPKFSKGVQVRYLWRQIFE